MQERPWQTGESAAGRQQCASGDEVYPAQGEAQGAWCIQPLKRLKWSKGLYMQKSLPSTITGKYRDDRGENKRKRGNSHKLLHVKFQPGKLPKAVHSNRVHRRFLGNRQQNSRTEGSVHQS